MSDFACDVTFSDFEPDHRTWLYVWSGCGEESRMQRTWTDGNSIRLEVRDIPGQASTEHSLIAFRRGRRPHWVPLPTGPSDKPAQLRLELEPEAELRFRVWIVAGDFERQRMRFMNALLLANFILREECTGIRLVPVEIVNAVEAAAGSGSTLVNGLKWEDHEEVAAAARALETMMNRRGAFDSETLNVFYVDEITGTEDAIHGRKCDEEHRCAIAIDRFGLDDLLLHEIGHALSLGDILNGDRPSKLPDNGLFSRYNVMRKFSYRRYFFTEGQIVATHFSPASILNANQPAGEASGRWFETCNPDDVLLGRLALAEDHLELIGHTAILPLRSVAFAESEVEDCIAASCERYQLRTWQLERQGGDADGDGAIGPNDIALHRLEAQDYIAADVARAYEGLICRRKAKARTLLATCRTLSSDLNTMTLEDLRVFIDRFQEFAAELENHIGTAVA